MKGSDNPFPSVLLLDQSAVPATPAAGERRLFIDAADGLLKWVNPDGTVSEGGGGGGGGPTDDGWYLEADGITVPAPGGNVEVSFTISHEIGAAGSVPWAHPGATPFFALPVDDGWYVVTMVFYVAVPATTDVLLTVDNSIFSGALQENGPEVFFKSTGTARSTFVPVTYPPVRVSGGSATIGNVIISSHLGSAARTIDELDLNIIKIA